MAIDRSERFAFDASTIVSQCVLCRHLARNTLGVAATCKAFPSAIPDEILTNEADHRKPFEGDEGMGLPGTHVLFEPREGVPEANLRTLYAVLDGV